MDWIKHFCAKDCPDTCGFYARINEHGLEVKVSDWDFLDTQFVCRKLKFFFEREVKNNKSYHFIDKKRVDLDTVLEKITNFLRNSENKRILYLRGSGNLGYSMFGWDVVLSQFNSVYFVDGGPCDETGIEAHIEDFDICTNPPINKLEEADNIVVFGKNAFVCSPHIYYYLKQLRNKKVVVYIDPIRTKTADLAHEFLQIEPGSDGVLANAVLNLLGKYKLKVDNVSDITGLSVEEIEFLVQLFEKGKTAIIEGYGLQRYRNGKNSIKWLNRLAYYTGNLDYLYYSRSSKEGIKKPNSKPKHTVFMSDVSELLKQGFFNAVFIVAANPTMSMPDNEIWKKALEEDEVIVVDTNFTQTTEFADIFLKVDGMFASKDIQGSYFFNKTLDKGAVSDGLSDLDAAAELAKRLGIKFKLSLDSVQKVNVQKRKFVNSEIEVYLPTKNDLVRLFSLPHPSYLNSQNIPKNEEFAFISTELGDELSIKPSDKVTISNGKYKSIFEAKITDMIKGNTAFVYKSRYDGVNRIFKSIPTDTKRGIAFNDTFVKIEKAED